MNRGMAVFSVVVLGLGCIACSFSAIHYRQRAEVAEARVKKLTEENLELRHMNMVADAQFGSLFKVYRHVDKQLKVATADNAKMRIMRDDCGLMHDLDELLKEGK